MRRAIERKRDGRELEAGTWPAIVEAYLDGRVDDAQLAALLMACVLRGMSPAEAAALTEAFVWSGERLEAPDPRTVDKHSSGGVADTASLIVVPMVAACGIPVAKLSGRALGHTGGTLDKLEAIDGVRTDLEPERFFACVRAAGCAIAAQSARLVPADKRIYALRDRTGTVPAAALIAASIVSKKIAGGAHGFVFDVKLGGGAFLREAHEARELAELLVTLSQTLGRRSIAVVTDMNEPLGPAIGTGLEAIEARDFLLGTRRDPRLAAVCEALGVAMLAVADANAGGGSDAPGREALRAALDNGGAYETFERMLAQQGARPGALAALQPHAERTPLRAARSGFVVGVDTVSLGEAARDLVARSGAVAGITLCARIGDAVRAGDVLATVFGDAGAASRLAAAFSLGDEAPPRRPLVYFETGSATSGTDATAAGSSTGPRSTLDNR
jgi:pyrimidine-nucleoside phosphorylase